MQVNENLDLILQLLFLSSSFLSHVAGSRPYKSSAPPAAEGLTVPTLALSSPGSELHTHTALQPTFPSLARKLREYKDLPTPFCRDNLVLKSGQVLEKHLHKTSSQSLIAAEFCSSFRTDRTVTTEQGPNNACKVSQTSNQQRHTSLWILQASTLQAELFQCCMALGAKTKTFVFPKTSSTRRGDARSSFSVFQHTWQCSCIWLLLNQS